MKLYDDKFRHYKYCLEKCKEINKKIKNKFFVAIIVFITVTLYKEIFHDFILGKGNFEIDDIKANFLGCYDFLMWRKNNDSNS